MANITTLDHLTITAPSLAVGAQHVFDTLGVRPQIGGEHPRMGTHNLLLRLGQSFFLEVIAINPAAPSPGRTRWFGLDALTPSSPASLTTWVLRTENINAAANAASENLGPIETMTRGELRWLITIPPDGQAPLQGRAPALIEWQTDTHPAQRLNDHSLSLSKLELHHPQASRMVALLDSLGLTDEVSVVEAPAGASAQLRAFIETPNGVRCLS